MIADFMTYRGIAIMVARLIDAGNWPLLLTAGVQSITQDYSWARIRPGPPACADRADVTRPLHLRGARALRCASRAGARDPRARLRASRRTLAGEARPSNALALGVAAVLIAYPAAMAVSARGMPDVGGLVLVVCALKLSERLARLLALRQGATRASSQ